MKKSAILMMAVMLLLGAAFPAQAADKPLEISFTNAVTLLENQRADILATAVASTVSGTINYTLTDNITKEAFYSETRSNIQAGDTISWPVPYDDTGLSSNQPVKKINATFTMDGASYSFSFFFYYSKVEGVPQILVEEATWFPHNTACSFGPQFREVSPSLTDKWYMFTPIDLTIQGRQEFEYVAGSMYVIGKVYVDVMEDQVIVTYYNYYANQGGNTQTEEEFFTFFPDYASVTTADPEQLQDQAFFFGQPISIEEDLGGDTNVLLFVRNKVTYRNYANNSSKLTRFWINLPDRVALRNEMLAMMD